MLYINKPKDRDLIVLNLTDFNMSTAELEEGSEARRIMDGTVAELIKRVKPDYITFTGDMSYGKSPENYHIFGEMMADIGVPWSFVWGNHDNEAEDVNVIADILSSYPNCLFEKGDPTLGNGNYAVTVLDDGKPFYGFVFMDTHNCDIETNEAGIVCRRLWGRPTPAQMKWYEDTVRSLGVKNTVLAHIPLYEYRLAFSEAWCGDYDTETVPFETACEKKNWKTDGAYGVRREGISSYIESEGQFDIIAKSGTTEMMIVGHNHTNCFEIPYRGIRLAFGLKTGKGGYWDPELNGGTKLTVGKDGIKLEYVFVDPAKFIG